MGAADLSTTDGSVSLLMLFALIVGVGKLEAFGHSIAVFLGRWVISSSSKFNRAGCFDFSLGEVNGQGVDVSSDCLFRALMLNSWCRSTLLLLTEALAVHAVEVFSSSIQTSIWVGELGQRHGFDYLLLISSWQNMAIIFSTHQRRKLLKLSHLKSMIIGIPSVIESENANTCVFRTCLQRHFSREDAHVTVNDTQIFHRVSGRAIGFGGLR